MSNATALPSRPRSGTRSSGNRGAGNIGAGKDVRRRPRPGVGKTVSVVLLVLGAIGMIAPFLWMFTTSLRDASHAYDLPPQWLPTEWDWSNYADAVSGPVPILKNMFNSAVIAITVSIGMIITAPMAGYAFAKLDFPGRNSIFVGLLSSLMVPAQVTIIPLFLLRQFFLGLPQEIIDAARMDGATAWQTYRLIALPLAKNAVSTLGVITFLGSWNAYFAPSIFLNSTDTATLPLGLVLMLGPYGAGNVAQVMAATTIAIAPALIVFLVAQRWIIASLTQSAVKG